MSTYLYFNKKYFVFTTDSITLTKILFGCVTLTIYILENASTQNQIKEDNYNPVPCRQLHFSILDFNSRNELI